MGRILKTVGVVVVVVFGVHLLGIGLVRCGGHHQVALEALRSCRLATHALGEDVDQSAFGFSCGSTETEGAFGRASWSMPVSGSKGSGRFVWAAEKRASAWRVLSAQLEVDDRTISVVPCTLVRREGEDALDGAEQACDNGDALSCNNLGVAHATGERRPRDPGKAAGYYRQGCEAGEAVACVNLGAMVERGQGTGKNLAAAVRLYQQACDQGHELGCSNLAVMLVQGRGTDKDPGRAADLLQNACKRDFVMACGQLGALHAEGLGVEKDEARAVALFRRACDKKHAQSCGNLGWMYANGLGLEKDMARAIDLYLEACDEGFGHGCHNLAVYYRERKKPELAARYFEKACVAGDQEACGELQPESGKDVRGMRPAALETSGP